MSSRLAAGTAVNALHNQRVLYVKERYSSSGRAHILTGVSYTVVGKRGRPE
jgi:hypothetical protein